MGTAPIGRPVDATLLNDELATIGRVLMHLHTHRQDGFLYVLENDRGDRMHVVASNRATATRLALLKRVGIKPLYVTRVKAR